MVWRIYPKYSNLSPTQTQILCNVPSFVYRTLPRLVWNGWHCRLYVLIGRIWWALALAWCWHWLALCAVLAYVGQRFLEESGRSRRGRERGVDKTLSEWSGVVVEEGRKNGTERTSDTISIYLSISPQERSSKNILFSPNINLTTLSEWWAKCIIPNPGSSTAGNLPKHNRRGFEKRGFGMEPDFPYLSAFSSISQGVWRPMLCCAGLAQSSYAIMY